MEDVEEDSSDHFAAGEDPRAEDEKSDEREETPDKSGCGLRRTFLWFCIVFGALCFLYLVLFVVLKCTQDLSSVKGIEAIPHVPSVSEGKRCTQDLSSVSGIEARAGRVVHPRPLLRVDTLRARSPGAHVPSVSEGGKRLSAQAAEMLSFEAAKTPLLSSRKLPSTAPFDPAKILFLGKQIFKMRGRILRRGTTTEDSR